MAGLGVKTDRADWWVAVYFWSCTKVIWSAKGRALVFSVYFGAVNESRSFPLIDKLLNNRILSHVLFWVLTFMLYSQILFHQNNSFWFGFVNNIVLFPSIIGASYFLIYYQIPKFIYPKKYWHFGLSLVASMYVFTVLARLLTIYIAEPVLGIDRPYPNMWAIVLISIDRLIQNYFFTVALGSLTVASIKMIKEHMQAKSQAEQLEKEKSQAELNFLKAQIHPHFLFNTLNNLYTLTLQKSDLAPTTVVKLSEMLDYMLYQCNDPEVPVSKELQLLNNYIDLERLRYGERLDFTFNHSIDKPDTPIAPLILLSLVENAFKHGVSGAIKKPTIRIALKVLGAQLDMEVFNTKPQGHQADLAGYKEGIGVSNIKRQLELVYAGRYAMDVQEKEDSYQVKLHIGL